MYSITFGCPNFTPKDIEWMKATLVKDTFIIDVQNKTQEVTFGGNRCCEIFLKSNISITFFDKKYATMFALKFPDVFIIEECYDYGVD